MALPSLLSFQRILNRFRIGLRELHPPETARSFRARSISKSPCTVESPQRPVWHPDASYCSLAHILRKAPANQSLFSAGSMLTCCDFTGRSAMPPMFPERSSVYTCADLEFRNVQPWAGSNSPAGGNDSPLLHLCSFNAYARQSCVGIHYVEIHRTHATTYAAREVSIIQPPLSYSSLRLRVHSVPTPPANPRRASEAHECGTHVAHFSPPRLPLSALIAGGWKKLSCKLVEVFSNLGGGAGDLPSGCSAASRTDSRGKLSFSIVGRSTRQIPLSKPVTNCTHGTYMFKS